MKNKEDESERKRVGRTARTSDPTMMTVGRAKMRLEIRNGQTVPTQGEAGLRGDFRGELDDYRIDSSNPFPY